MAEEVWGDEDFVTSQFKRYYTKNAYRVRGPSDYPHREFGFLSFSGKNMYRHVGFDDLQSLRTYLMDNAPSHSYYSTAYYEYPRATMDKKNWLGADLVFDIDVDHFYLPCQERHDRWTCRQCGKIGAGHSPETCPKCHNASFNEESWLCRDCLETGKNETQKLVDILVQDFGVNPKSELTVNFSGHRGYHVHVKNPKVKQLGQVARREMVDYIMGVGIEAQFHGFTSRNVGGGSAIGSGGWRTRTVKALYEYLSRMSETDAKALNLRKPSSEKLFENRDELLKLLMDRHPSGIFRYMSEKTLEKLLSVAVKGQASEIDTVVTTDLKRLIRLHDALHGKTGWLTQKIPEDQLTDYDPFEEAIAFRDGEVKLNIKHTPMIEMMGKTYGPYDSEVVTVPLAVGIFILCRKAGRLV